jgi:hypothetical protein
VQQELIVEHLIDDEGIRLISWDISIEDAVWQRGFIHINHISDGVIVSLCPQLALPITKSVALYEIAKLYPRRVFLRTAGPRAKFDAFFGFSPAFRKIHALCVAVGTEKPCPVYPVDERGDLQAGPHLIHQID